MPVVTVIQHGADVPLERFGDWLQGVDLRLVRAWTGEPVPSTPGQGLLVLGGKMSAHDDDVAPWLPATRRLIAEAVSTEVPMLGICLGHQLLARATGGAVEVAAPAGRELGVVEIRWRPGAEHDAVLGAVGGGVGAAGAAGARGPAVALQPSAHADAVVELPPGASWLAESATYPVQALRVGSALGVQFHPEASPELLASWAHSSGADAEAVLAHARERDAAVARTGRAIAEAFAAQVRAAA